MRWIALTFAIVVVLDATIDMGKWAIGRYTSADILLSYAVLLAGSAVLACAFEYLHRWRRRQERLYEQYVHHGVLVWVRKDIKGKHWDPTICVDCEGYHPQTKLNCPIAEGLFTICKERHLTLAVWECPQFKRC